MCKRHTHASHTSTYTHKDKHTANVLLGTSYHVLKSATFPLCLTSYFFGGSTFSSKKPWLTTFPAGKYLATTKEDPSLADAFPTPIFFVFFHTMAVKCPVGGQAGGEGNRLVIRAWRRMFQMILELLYHLARPEEAYLCKYQSDEGETKHTNCLILYSIGSSRSPTQTLLTSPLSDTERFHGSPRYHDKAQWPPQQGCYPTQYLPPTLPADYSYQWSPCSFPIITSSSSPLTSHQHLIRLTPPLFKALYPLGFHNATSPSISCHPTASSSLSCSHL